MESHENPLMQIHETFEAYDFIDDAHFDQFIDLIRGENENSMFDFDRDLITGCLVDSQSNPIPEYMSDQLGGYGFGGEVKAGEKGEEEEENDGEGESSSAITTTMSSDRKRAKVDRSRTLISERRRRGRMKEKLYTLRSLVPNITKMDKASIVGDAVLYVQELQMQAKKLKAEIADLEASIAGSERNESLSKKPKKNPSSSTNLVSKKTIQMDIFQVTERGFYLRLVCNKGEGMAMSVFKVLESLTSLNVQSSNLLTAFDKYVLNATLNVKDCEEDMNLPNVKLLVTGALLNQGFEFN